MIGASKQTPYTLPHAALIEGVSRMPSSCESLQHFGENARCPRQAQNSSASVDPIMLDCECSSYQNYDGGAFVG